MKSLAAVIGILFFLLQNGLMAEAVSSSARLQKLVTESVATTLEEFRKRQTGIESVGGDTD